MTLKQWWYPYNQFRNWVNDKKSKICFFFDKALIVPEYLVEFDYQMTEPWADSTLLAPNDVQSKNCIQSIYLLLIFNGVANLPH